MKAAPRGRWGAVVTGALLAATAGAETPAADGDAAWAAVRTRAEAIHSFRGRATLTFTGAEEGVYEVAFGRVRPDAARMEVSSPLGAVALILTARDGKLLAYNVGERAAGFGPDSAEHLAAALDADVGANLTGLLDWFAACPGEPAAGDAGCDVRVEPRRDEGGRLSGYAVSWVRRDTGETAQELTTDAAGTRLTAARSQDRDGGAVEVRYDDWRETDGVAMPRRVTFTTPDLTADVKVTKLAVNVEIPAEAFSLDTPPGTEDIFYWLGPGEIQRDE